MGIFPLDKTGTSLIFSPIKSLNSLGEISPNPLNLVISEEAPISLIARFFLNHYMHI